MNIIKKTLSVLTVLSLIPMTGCGEKQSDIKSNIIYYDSSNVYSQSDRGVEESDGDFVPGDNLPENTPTTPASIGEKAEVAGVEVTLVEVLKAGSYESTDSNIPEKDVFAFVFEITNNSSEDVEVNSFDLSIDKIDNEFTHITTGVREMMIAERKITDMDSLNTVLSPGDSVKGYSSIALAQGWQDFTACYCPVDTGSQEALAYLITPADIKEL